MESSRVQSPLHTTVNGQACTSEVEPDESALGFLRERLGLTGAKLGCGHGACGACVVRLDGVPVASCLLPATSLHGRAVTTVEGLGPPLHPVQRAFMAADALQCGYCTPGFIVEAVAFYERWRAAHADALPSREEVAAALCGHLCRCGAQAAIFEAVHKAVSGAFDSAGPIVARQDAEHKVTGRAVYTVDVRAPGMLHARILRSPYAHARITRLDLDQVRALPGVRAVWRMVNPSGLIRYAGQELVALAATDAAMAAAALAQIDVAYQVERPLLSIDEALAPDAAPVYPDRKQRKQAPNANEGPLMPARWHGNLRGPFGFFSTHAPRAARTLAAAASDDSTLVGGRYATHVQCHTALEPHACVASWQGERLTVHCSTQAVTRMKQDIAERWHLHESNVQVIAHYVGGGFGAKADLGPEMIAAVELARAAGQPVRLVLDRREELTVGGLRPAQQIDLQLAVDAGGALSALRAIGHADSGVAVGSSSSVMFRYMYRGAPKILQDWDVVTHAPPGKPFRGPGGPPAFFALEQAVDAAAHSRGEDPIVMRRRWDDNPPRLALFDWVESLAAWRTRGNVAADRGRYRRGVGVACGGWPAFAHTAAQVQVESSPAGVLASCASQDMGNGTRTAIAWAVAGVLGVSPSEISVRVGDSNDVPGPMSAGSRTTASVVPAAEEAAGALRNALLSFATQRWQLSDARPIPGGLEHAGGQMSWSQVFAEAPPLSFVGRRRRDKGGYVMPFTVAGLAVSKYLSGSVQVTEVVVDTRLGRVRVEHVWAGFGVGRIVVPLLARSQAQGGIIQGLSYALYEERRLDPARGGVLTGGLEDYRIIGLGDVPEIDVHFYEGGFDNVTGGAVGLGELVTLATPASLANAVFHATGWRPRELPLRPDRVLMGIRS